MKKALIMAVAACIMAAPAMAETPKDKMMTDKKADMWFSKIDANGDGMISMDEHNKFGEDMFKKPTLTTTAASPWMK